MVLNKSYSILSNYYDKYWGGFTDQYLAFLKELLAVSGLKEARVLDLACGTGDLAIGLAEAGHKVLGIDLSPDMIAKANEKGTNLDNLEFAVQDMASFKVKGKFSLVTCAFDSLNYLLEPGQVGKMFQLVVNHLEEDGLFVFDFNTPRLYKEHHNGIIEREGFTQSLDYQVENQLAITTFQFADNRKELHYQRPYIIREVQELLAQAGLGVIDIFSSLDGQLYKPEQTKRAYVVAGKTL